MLFNDTIQKYQVFMVCILVNSAAFVIDPFFIRYDTQKVLKVIGQLMKFKKTLNYLLRIYFNFSFNLKIIYNSTNKCM